MPSDNALDVYENTMDKVGQMLAVKAGRWATNSTDSTETNMAPHLAFLDIVRLRCKIG